MFEYFNKLFSEPKIERPWINNKVQEAMYGEYEVTFISQNKKIGTLTICCPGPYRDVFRITIENQRMSSF